MTKKSTSIAWNVFVFISFLLLKCSILPSHSIQSLLNRKLYLSKYLLEWSLLKYNFTLECKSYTHQVSNTYIYNDKTKHYNPYVWMRSLKVVAAYLKSKIWFYIKIIISVLMLMCTVKSTKWSINLYIITIKYILRRNSALLWDCCLMNTFPILVLYYIRIEMFKKFFYQMKNLVLYSITMTMEVFFFYTCCNNLHIASFWTSII